MGLRANVRTGEVPGRTASMQARKKHTFKGNALLLCVRDNLRVVIAVHLYSVQCAQTCLSL